jgi:hypothetical protein
LRFEINNGLSHLQMLIYIGFRLYSTSSTVRRIDAHNLPQQGRLSSPLRRPGLLLDRPGPSMRLREIRPVDFGGVPRRVGRGVRNKTARHRCAVPGIGVADGHGSRHHGVMPRRIPVLGE